MLKDYTVKVWNTNCSKSNETFILRDVSLAAAKSRALWVLAADGDAPVDSEGNDTGWRISVKETRTEEGE